MTICIAAIAENKYVVMAADRTLTLEFRPLEFGHEHITKLYDISNNCIVGTAGSPIPIPDILRVVKRNKNIKSTQDLINTIVNAITEKRKEKFEQETLRRFGWDYNTYEEFYKTGAIYEAHARRILEAMDQFHLCVHFIVGSILQSEPSIHTIEDPGDADCYDTLGYAAIGSGEDYALQTLLRANYTPEFSLIEAIYTVFESKKSAEQALGVGRRTDIRILTGKKPIILKDEEISNLNEIYDTKLKDQEKYKEDKILTSLKKWMPKELRKL